MRDKGPTCLLNPNPLQNQIACDWHHQSENVTYHVQREHGVNLDQAVKIAEENRDRQQKEIHRVSDIVAQQLDKLRREHPTHEKNKAQCLRILVPGSRAFEK